MGPSISIRVPATFESWVEPVGDFKYTSDDDSKTSIKALYGVLDGDLFFVLRNVGLTVSAGKVFERTVIWTPDSFRPLVHTHPGMGWYKAKIGSPVEALQVLMDFPIENTSWHTSQFHDLLVALQDARQIHRSIHVMEG